MTTFRGLGIISFGVAIGLLLFVSGCQERVESAGPKAMEAILKHDYKTAETLAQSVPGLGNYEEKGALRLTVLHRAAYAGQPKLVDLLIANGGDVNNRRHDGGTVLHSAVAGAKNTETIRRIIAAKVDINAVDNNGETSLHSVVRVPNVAAVRTLIEAGANTSTKDKYGKTPLQTAKNMREVLTKANAGALDDSLAARAQAVAVKTMAGKGGDAAIDEIIALLEAKGK